MSWFNYYGLIIMICLMIPNVLMAMWDKESFENHFQNKALETAEQIGRFGSFGFMIINIPFTYFGWIFPGAQLTYIIFNAVLIIAYELIWLMMRKKNNLVRAILLSVIPSVIFIFSGIMICSIPLIVCSILFAVCHITISVKNARFVTTHQKSFPGGGFHDGWNQ